MTALAIILVFGSMVLMHEFGHYIVAKMIGVRVIEFSMGFGPKIVGHQTKETFYSLRLVPLGGFVKLHGIDPEMSEDGIAVIAAEDDPRSFLSKPVWQRMAVIAAGPLMNFVLAIIIFIGVFAFLGIPKASTANIVGDVLAGRPASAIGIRPGEKILAVNGEATPDWQALTVMIHARPEQTIELTVEKSGSGERQTITVTTDIDADTGRGLIGITPEIVYVQIGVVQSAKYGIEQTVDFTVFIVVALVKMVTGKIPADVGGPVMIAQVIGEGVNQGLVNVLSLTGILSIQLGLINLFPIPALDGSRLVFLLVEGVRGKPLKPERENMIHFIGFVLLMALMVFITYKDVLRLFVKEG